MEANKFNNVFYAIIYSFFSKSFYQYSLKNWRKKYFAYLSLVIFILSILVTTRVVINANDLANAYLAEILPTMPTLELKEGKLSAKPDNPYFIYLPKTNLPTLVIDTKNQYKNFSKDSSLVLMGADKYYFKISNNDIRSYSYSQSDNIIINSEILRLDFNRYHLKAIATLSVVTWVISYIILFIFYNIFIGFLAIFTATFAGCANIKFNYRFYLKLTTLSATFPSLFFMVLYLGGWLNLNTFLIYLFSQITYLILSIYFIYDIKQ